MQVLILIIGLLLFLIYKWFNKNHGYWKERNVPYLKPVPFLGNLFDFFLQKYSFGQFFERIYNSKNEPYIGFYMLNKHALLIKDLEIAKNVLIKDFNYFPNHQLSAPEDLDPISGAMLISLKDDKWRFMRSRLTTVFTKGKIKNSFNILLKISEDLENVINSIVEKDGILDTKDITSRFTIDIISSYVFGVEDSSLYKKTTPFKIISDQILQNSFIDQIKVSLSVFGHDILRWTGIKPYKSHSYHQIRNLVWNNINYREKNNVVRNDFLDILIKLREQNKNEIADGQNSFVIDGDLLVAQAFIFLIAGNETSSTTISLTLYELAFNPALQEKTRNNIQEVLKKYDGQITYEAIKEMAYLDQVMNETLRKYPPLSFLDRQCIKNYQVPGTDLIIEKGTQIFVSLLGIHYDPTIYPNPEVYDPDRFSEENLAKRHKLSHMPFGEGPRICLGMKFGILQTKIGLVKILNKFKVLPLKNTPYPFVHNPKGFLLDPKETIRLQVSAI